MRPDTKETILDTAEKLFSERGIDAVSLRTIITEAGVNLAAVHYHFGSKDRLVQEVYARRIRPLNEERLALLDQYEAGAGEGPLPVEDVLRALFAPSIRLARDPERGHIFLRLCGRFWAEADSRLGEMFEGIFREVIERFLAAFRRALPHLPPEEIFWRSHFAVGSLAHTMMDSDRLKKISAGRCDTANVEETIERMVQYSAAGMKAPVLRPAENEEIVGASAEGVR